MAKALGRIGLRWPDGLTLALAAIGALGASLALAREISYGVALDRSAVDYVFAAQGLLAGEWWNGFGGIDYARYAPLYPALLAIASGLGALDPRDAAGPLNAAAFALTIFAAGTYLRRRLSSRLVAAWACLALAVAVPLGDSASWALAGTPFILLATLALIQADRHLADGGDRSLWLAAAFSALAWLTRYEGVAVVVAIELLIATQPAVEASERRRRLGRFALIAAMPMGLWLLLNWLMAGTLPGSIDTAYSLQDAGVGLMRWVYWNYFPGTIWLLLGIGIAIPLADIGIRTGIRARPGWRATIAWLRPYRGAFSVFGAVYAAALIAALLTGWTAQVGTQAVYLAPLYIPIMVAAAIAADRFIGRERKRERGAGWPAAIARTALGARLPGALMVGAIAAMAAWVGGQALQSGSEIARANNSAHLAQRSHLDVDWRGYATPKWTESETLRHARARWQWAAGMSYSNARVQAYVNGGLFGVAKIPIDDGQSSGREQLERWLEDAEEGALVVWLTNRGQTLPYAFGAADMRTSAGLELLADLSDGAVFRVNKARAADNPYAAAYAAATAGEYGAPALRRDFDVYRDGNRLVYARENCAAADTEARFILHIIPEDWRNLPPLRMRPGFENFDFDFKQYGAHVDGRCIAIRALPDYEIAFARTGQYVSGEPALWRVSFRP